MRSVVVDTNVFISAALKGEGNPSRIISLVSDGEVRLYYSEEILAEYVEVLSRAKFHFSKEKQTASINKIK